MTDRLDVQPVTERENRLSLSIVIPTTRSYRLSAALAQQIEHLGVKQRVTVIVVVALEASKRLGPPGDHGLDRPYVQVHVLTGDLNPGLARNVGMQVATSDFVSFADDDDILNLESLLVLLTGVSPHSVDVIGGSYLDQSSKATRYHLAEPSSTFVDAIRPVAGVWRFAFSATFLQRHALFFPERLYAEDLLFLLKVCCAGPRFMPSPIPAYTYVASDPSRLTSRVPRLDDVLGALDEIQQLALLDPSCQKNGFGSLSRSWSLRIRLWAAKRYLESRRYREALIVGWSVIPHRQIMSSMAPWR